MFKFLHHRQKFIDVDLHGDLRIDVFHHHPAVSIVGKVGKPTKRGDSGNKMATLVTITDEQKVDVDYTGAQLKDAAGNAVGSLDAAATVGVTVNDGDIVSAVVNGQVVSITSEDAINAASVGQTQIPVSISNPDGTSLTDVIAVTVTPSAPTSVSGSVGTPSQR